MSAIKGFLDQESHLYDKCIVNLPGKILLYLSLKEIKPIIRCCKLCIEANIMLSFFCTFFALYQ